MEFSADKEFYSIYLDAAQSLIKQGWQEGKPRMEGRTISTIFTKDGYGIFLLYGCEEEVKDEVL